jgi:glycosyltransferase involved in cell wall biosynthesis
VKVAVLTTSYPRWEGDAAGAFVADTVRHAREAGVEIEVVSPASFPHFGLAYGYGISGNLKAAPWKLLLLPAFLAAFTLAARRASRGADVVHAHWLVSGLVGLATRKPLVVQPWGTDVELLPWLGRIVLPRARLVVAASEFLAEAARRLGAREVRVIPVSLAVPEHVGEPAEPPQVLFVGRLSEEKGILEFLEATQGLPRVIVGDGPLRARVPERVGWVPRERLGEYYERAAVVCVPSRREGYGMVAREAMAYGRPVVATAVGGLVDAVEDGETGLLVPPVDPKALGDAVARLLADTALRRRLGAAARASVSDDRAAEALLAVYRDASVGRFSGRRHSVRSPG